MAVGSRHGASEGAYVVAAVPQTVAAVEEFRHRTVVGYVVGLQEIAHILYAHVYAGELHIYRHALLCTRVERTVCRHCRRRCRDGTILRVLHHRVVAQPVARGDVAYHPADVLVPAILATGAPVIMQAKLLKAVSVMHRFDILRAGQPAYSQNIILQCRL